MKFVVVGAGAIGAFLGAYLARAGEDVTLVARGPHLAAMQTNGVRVRSADGEFVARPPCTDDLAVVGEADVVFLTVKAHSLPAIAPRLGALLRPTAAVVSAQNGIPWWYFQRHGGPLDGIRLTTVDPDGVIARSIDPYQIIGCVVWPATIVAEPGVIVHQEGNRFTIGELDGTRSERCQAIAAALIRAGLKCPISSKIRTEIWLKLLGNVAFNPLSALTRATLAEIASDPTTRPVARAIMVEAAGIASKLGIELPISVDQRLIGAEKVGAHKTSMLQDLEHGRPLEVGPLVGAVVEIGRLLGISMPYSETVYACAKLLSETIARAEPAAR